MKFKVELICLLLYFLLQFSNSFKLSTILENLQSNNFDIMRIIKNETSTSNKETVREEQKVLSHKSNHNCKI